MKASELIGPALDWAVAKCEGMKLKQFGKGEPWYYAEPDGTFRFIVGYAYSPSTNWSQGGPIIEREDIAFRKYHHPGTPAHGTYYAKVCKESGQLIAWYKARDVCGPTPLIAAMRCFVASELGEEVEISERLS